MVDNFRTYLIGRLQQTIVLTKLPSAYRTYPRIEKPNSSKRPVTVLDVVDIVDW